MKAYSVMPVWRVVVSRANFWTSACHGSLYSLPIADVNRSGGASAVADREQFFALRFLTDVSKKGDGDGEDISDCEPVDFGVCYDAGCTGLRGA